MFLLGGVDGLALTSAEDGLFAGRLAARPRRPGPRLRQGSARPKARRVWSEPGPLPGTGRWPGTRRSDQHLKPERVLLLLLGWAGVWAMLWKEAGFAALAGAVAWNSCARVGWAWRAVWVWGAALWVCPGQRTGSPEAEALAAPWSAPRLTGGSLPLHPLLL